VIAMPRTIYHVIGDVEGEGTGRAAGVRKAHSAPADLIDTASP
jgi:hypothetical protein